MKCKGGTIDSFARVNDILFKKCNVIEGYLEIELRCVHVLICADTRKPKKISGR